MYTPHTSAHSQPTFLGYIEPLTENGSTQFFCSTTASSTGTYLSRAVDPDPHSFFLLDPDPHSEYGSRREKLKKKN